MTLTRVVHCKNSDYDVYIGRRPDGNGEWGNPFTIGVHGTRAEVIQQYREWVIGQPLLIEKIKRTLKGKVLGCWCKPKCCHGDVLAEIADDQDLIEW